MSARAASAAAAGLGIAALLPLFVGASSSALDNMVLAAAFVIMALGLNVVVGFAGLLDLGYVAFFAIGAHVAAYFGSAFWANAAGGAGIALFVGEPTAGMPGIHFNFLIVLVLAIVATTIAGVLIGVPTLRVRGDYVGIVTLAFGEIIGQVVANGRQIELFGGSLTGGPAGMSVIDRIDLPFLERFGALDLRPWYWFALALVALMLFVNFRLRDSRLGRAWIALRDDEGAAASAGVPIVRTKLLAYGVGGALGGVSGAFLASSRAPSIPISSRSRSRSTSSPWSCSAAWARSGASSPARYSCPRSTTTCCPRSSTTFPAWWGWTSTSRRSRRDLRVPAGDRHAAATAGAAAGRGLAWAPAIGEDRSVLTPSRAEGPMPLYLGRFSYTSDAKKALVSQPQDRSAAAREVAESLGASSWASGTPSASSTASS